MAETQDYKPSGFTTATIQLTVTGAAAYVEFLKKAFNAVEIDRSPMPNGKLMHATVQIGDSRLTLIDHMPEFGAKPIPDGPWPFRINLYFPDADAQWAQALGAGCKEVFPLRDQFWGDRFGEVQDPMGVAWGIATRKEHLTIDEMNARGKKLFGG